MTVLEEYRALSARISEAAVRWRDAHDGFEREAALRTFESLCQRRDTLVGLFESMFEMHTRTHLSCSGPLHERLMALSPAGRRAFASRSRLEVAVEDFHVHLLAWADEVYDRLSVPELNNETLNNERRDRPATQTRR